MAGQFGIQNLDKANHFLAELGNVLEKVIKEQGGVGAKLAHVTALLDEMLLVTGMSLQGFKDEISELDEEDIAQLVASFKQKFDLSDDQAEALVEEALVLVVEGVDYGAKVVSFAKKVKAGKVAA